MTHNEIMMTKLGDSQRSFAWFTTNIIKKFTENVLYRNNNIVALKEEGYVYLLTFATLVSKDPNPIFDEKVLDTSYTFRENMANIAKCLEDVMFDNDIYVLPLDVTVIVLTALVITIPAGYDAEADAIVTAEQPQA